jgi:hypothetical protein
MHNDYFWHKAYGDYPVVGEMDKQKLLCLENTKQKNSYIKSKKKGHDLINSFRLPTEGMGVFCKRRIRVSNLSLGGPYTKMTEVVFLQISNQTGRLCRSGIVHS